MLVIIAQMARDVPSALPWAVAKKAASELVNSFAPPGGAVPASRGPRDDLREPCHRDGKSELLLKYSDTSPSARSSTSTGWPPSRRFAISLVADGRDVPFDTGPAAT
jgi:hypothetical protein